MRGVLRWRQAAGGVALAILLAGAPASAQTGNLVRGVEMRGFGRMIFTLRETPRVTAHISSGVLILSFGAAVNVDPDNLPNELPNYVGAARGDPEGRELRFALARPVRPNIMEAGERVFVDLLPQDWVGAPPPLPQDVVDELARRAREAEEALRRTEQRRAANEARIMPVHVARTPTLTRIVFEMPVVAPVRQRRVENRIELVFEAMLKIDGARLKADLGDAVKAVEASGPGPSTTVTIALNDGAEASGFREDETFVVDLPRPARRASPETAPAPPKAASSPPPPKQAEAPKSQGATDKPAEERPASDKAAQEKPVEERPAREKPAPNTAVAVAAAPTAPAPAPRTPTEPVRPVASRDGDTIRILLPFRGSPPAAAFERFGVVTVLIDTRQPLLFADTPPELREAGGAWEMSQAGEARILRLAFNEPKLARLAPEGEGWLLTIGDRVAAASEPLAPIRMFDDRGRPALRIPLPRAGRAYWIEDARTGERIAVVPAAGAPRSTPKPYRFPEFELAPTAQGVAVVATADDLVVAGGVDEVTVSRGDGLTISPRADAPAATSAAPEPAQAFLFDRARWEQARGGAALQKIRALQRQAAEATRGRKRAARLDLAFGLMALGLEVEARGAIGGILADEPDAALDRTVALMRIAIATRTRRFDEARKLIAEDRMRDDPEALLWRSVIDAEQRNWPRAAAGFRAAEVIIDAYPLELQASMRALRARAALESRDFAVAIGEIETLERAEFGGLKRPAELALLRARVDEGQGRPDEALAAYSRVAETDDRAAAAEAGMRAALLGLDDGAMPRNEAIARLETVAATWRGDGFVEPEAIAALGRIYADEHRWRDAFLLARRGNELYPDNEKIRAVHDHAASLFEKLFADGEGDSIDRVEALALFYDFRDFTPPGRRGDDIVRRLAERLVELDLLDSAAELMQHQMEHRVTGPQRSVLAARLAVIQLMNRKPMAALATLKATRLTDLPASVKRARSLLEARALADLSRTELALEMLAPESGADVDRLTADIQWRGARWRGAGETYERILGDRWKAPGELDDRDRNDVLRAAIAYSLAEEPLSLDRLRAKYAGLMANSSEAHAFQIVTSPSPARAREFRELAQRVARSDTFADFLAEYRKSYPTIPPGVGRKPAPAATARNGGDVSPATSAPQKPAEGAPTQG